MSDPLNAAKDVLNYLSMAMKRLILYAFAAGFIISSSDVVAAQPNKPPPDSAKLTIEGRIVPGPCNLNLDPPYIHLGEVRAEHLKDVPFYEGNQGQVRLSVICPTKTAVGITMKDELEDANPFPFRMYSSPEEPLSTLRGILKSEDTVVGVYSLQLEEMSYIQDSTQHGTVPIGRRTVGAGDWGLNDAKLLNGNEYHELSWKDSEESVPAIGEEFYANILVTPFFRPAKELDLSREIVYQGKATITLTY